MKIRVSKPPIKPRISPHMANFRLLSADLPSRTAFSSNQPKIAAVAPVIIDKKPQKSTKTSAMIPNIKLARALWEFPLEGDFKGIWEETDGVIRFDFRIIE